ncbi:hypothetical protein [Streptomyces sp. NPDC087859]
MIAPTEVRTGCGKGRHRPREADGVLLSALIFSCGETGVAT